MGFALSDASVVFAQDGQHSEPEMADPSEHQLSLNDDAVRAIIEDDYARAVALLEEARSLGELNVTFLNLGRAYQKLNKCHKARDAFERALRAPRVSQPPPAFVEKKVAEYLAELDEQCPQGEQAAASEQQPDESQTATDADAHDDVAPPPQVDEPSNVLAWTLTLTGVAVMAGGGTMLALAAGERDEIRSQPEPGTGVVTERTMKEASEIESRANTFDTVGVSALAGGAVISAVGAYLFLAGDAESPSDGAAVSVNADRVQLQWRVQF